MNPVCVCVYGLVQILFIFVHVGKHGHNITLTPCYLLGADWSAVDAEFI
jgi:hypothetical protein